MKDDFVIPYNDVCFYGLSLRDRENSDVRYDIYANILKRYMNTLRPVSNRLYRATKNNKYEYNYSFIPSKPFSWRVIKNKRIIEDIEYLSDGKYCLNYYDDQGNDVKRIHFSSHHKWLKTNYYNTIYGNDLVCSIVPKEQNGQTVILKYVTGVSYPVTLYCCPSASCEEVFLRVIKKIPEPDLMALTNYGILYYANEETLNIYNQVLSEEEEKYAEETKPEVFTTEEDIAGGFCFSVDNFDSTKNNNAVFDLSEARELSDDTSDNIAVDHNIIETNETEESSSVDYSKEVESSFSVDADIISAIKAIADATDIHIDEEVVIDKEVPAAQGKIEESIDDFELFKVSESEHNDDTALILDIPEENDNILMSALEESEIIDNTDYDDIPIADEIIAEEVVPANTEDAQPSGEEEVLSDDLSAGDILSMDDEGIDDYVRTLIDSMLSNAKEAASEYTLHSEDGFASGAQELSSDSDVVESASAEKYIEDNTPDSVIESNGASYYYYGETDKNGHRTGRGRTLMSDGKTAYEGEYLDDKRHGVGSFYYKDGNLCYWGDWSENLRNGFGVGVSSDTGLVHIGKWKNNKPSGVGVRFDNEGRFMYIDSACEKVNGGIRITSFSEDSFTVEYWDEKSLKVIKKEISVDDILK